VEQDLAGRQAHFLGFAIGPGKVGDELDHAVSDVGQPIVVGGDEYQAPHCGQSPYQGEDPLHLDVVEVGGGLVSHHQGWFVHEGPCDGHALQLGWDTSSGFTTPPEGSRTLATSTLGAVKALRAIGQREGVSLGSGCP
jgi:hypothetical protein